MTDYLRLAQERAPQATEEQDNPYVPLARQAQELGQNRARTVIEMALKDDPDIAAERLRLSQTSGVPLRIVERNLEELRIKERARAIDLVSMAQESPVLYRQLIDPTFATPAIDDLDTLKRIERTVGKGVSYVMGADGQGGLANDVKGAAVDLGLAATAGVGEMVFNLSGVVNDLIGWQSGAQAARAQANASRNARNSFGLQAESSTSEAVKSGLQSAGTNLALLPLGLSRQLWSTANQAASAVAGLMAAGVGADAYLTAREKGLSSVQSATFAIPQAGFEYVFEKIPASKLFGDISANTSLMKMLGKQAVSEGWTEQLTTLTQDFNEWMNLNQDKTLAQFIQERPEAAYQTFIATLVGVGVQTSTIRGINKVIETANNQALVFEQDRLAEQMALASQSLLRQRSPEQFRAHVQRVVDESDGAKKEIYVDGEVLNQLPEEVLAQLPESVRAQIPEAVELRSTVSIPMADVLTIAPGTELEQILNDNARMRPNASSRLEAQMAAELIQQEADRVLQQAADQTTWQASSAAVQQTILEQLTATGRFSNDVNEAYATLQANFFSTMAARLGITPQEMYQRYALRVASRNKGGPAYSAGRGLTVEAFHYSKAARPVISTAMFGTGLQGSNRDLYLNAEDQRLRKRAYFYVDKGTGINPEAGVGGIAQKATLTNIYDADADPLRLKKGGQLAFESAVLDAGFSGYLTRMDGTQSGQVIVLGNQNIPTEAIGPATQLRGQVVPAPQARESLGRDVIVDALQAAQGLPSGSPTRARWSELLQAQLPEVHAALQAAGVFEGNQNDTLYKSDLIREFENKTEAPVYEQSLSSRLPGGKKATEDPLADTLAISWDVALRDEDTLAKNVAAMQKYPNFPKLTGKGAKSTERNAEAIITHMVDNLLWLHDHMPAEMRERARLWYDGGRKTVEAWADRYGITEMQGAAAIAVLSPQNGWFANVSQAERIADMVFGLRDFAWDDAMTAEAERISSEDGLDDKMKAAQGKTLGELLAAPDIAARWIRVFDQTYNNRAYRVLTPEGGAADYVKTGKGTDATMMWKSYSTIAKAVSVLLDGRAENVHYQIGKEHKVRNFYNNIFAPDSELGYATIDTHAVAAALLRPLASADTEVGQAFGGAGSSSTLSTGLNGTYPIYWEAYRRAAEARGIQPRQMQSITWEAVRGLFEAAQKKSMKADANAIWNRYKKGEITQTQAQQEILALAGGITPPSWTEVVYNDTPSRTYEGPAQRVIDERGSVGGPETPATRVMFEVAPDPNDAALTAEWNALSSEERLALSQQVAADIVPKVLTELGTGGDFVMQLGGYMGATNPSMTLRLERPELALTAAKLLGYALSQDSMMVVSENQIVGTDEVGAVTIKLPEGYGETEVAALYDRLYELQANGEPLVGGHTTADGQTVILNYSPLTTEELAATIFNHLGAEFDVDTNVVYSAFPTKDNYGYGQTDAPSEGDAAARQSPAQKRPDRLRSEATQQLRAALDAAAAGGAAATYAQAGGVNGVRPEQTGDRAGRAAGAGPAPLPGAPVIEGATGPDPRLVAVAEQYARDNGIDLKRQAEYVQVDPERAARIAQAYEEMAHAPNDPAVQEAYQNLIQQTVAQYRALEAAGYKFWFIDPENDPYKSPWDAMREMRASQTMGVFPTVAGFGSGATDVDISDNPLMGDTGIQWPYGSLDGEMKPVLANDLFRAVHDAFGHGLEGAGFRAQGEENAWQAHIRLFTGSAKGAITSETRGQNSWLNFGPYGESNRTAKVENTVFADQKTGLMPEWTWTEGLAGDMAERGGVYNQGGPLLAPNGKPSNLTPELHALVRTPEFKAWFGDWEVHATAENPVGSLWSDPNVSKAVDENGEPLVMYHGTDTAGFTEFETPGGTGRGDLGIFMTPNREMARTYVKRGRGRELERDQVIAANEEGDRLSGLYPVFANIRNPLESDFEGANWSGERFGQFVVEDENGEQVYTADGRTYLTEDEAQALAEETGGTVEPAPEHYETTDSVVREARGGNDGAIIRNVTDDGGGASAYAGEPSDVFVAFEPTQIKAVDNFGTFNAQDPNMYKQGPRGTFNPQDLLITLNENADLSTFLHESGHFFLEVMADLASQSDAPQQIRDDMKAVLKWFGVRSLATWNQMTLDEKRPYHEKWAESFEQYLFEGQAPSIELQPLFRRFRSWLVNVYKSLTQFMRGRNLQVNDEIRQVMGRLIATDEQIAQAEEAAGMLPDFDATNEAIEKLQSRSLRDLKWTIKARDKYIKQLTREAYAMRKDVEDEVRKEVEAEPIYRALRFFTKGVLDLDNQTNQQRRILDSVAGGSTKLDLAALKEMYGDGPAAPWRYLSVGKNGIAGKEGFHPDMAADMFGFKNGDHLVRSILDAEPIDSVVEGKTDQRMLERHGDLATPEAIADAANEAVHNEARARSLATELKSQAEMMNVRQDTGRTATNGRAITVNAVQQAAKQFAANIAARRRVKDLRNAAWQHRSAEARAGKRWQEATTKGETENAMQAKRDQLLNNLTVKALQEAQAEAKKILEFFRKVTKDSDEKTVQKGRDPDVVNAMRAILAAYDVAPRLEKSALEYMETVGRNDPAMYGALKPVVDAALLNAKPLPEMTMEELRGLNDELRSMWVLAKRSRQMEVDGNLLDIEEAADELMARMDVIGIPATVPGEQGAITDREERGLKLQFAKSILSRVEQWAERLDGKFGGPFLRLVFQPVKDAADRYRTDKVAYRKKFTELLKGIAPQLPPGSIEAPELCC